MNTVHMKASGFIGFHNSCCNHACIGRHFMSIRASQYTCLPPISLGVAMLFAVGAEVVFQQHEK